MTTSVMPSPLTDIFDTEPILEPKMAYLEARALLRLHDFILRYFEMEKDKGLDQATVARRLGMDRGQLSRMLGVSGNWTIKSATRLAAAIGGEVDFTWVPLPQAEEPRADETIAKTIAAVTASRNKQRERSGEKPPSSFAPRPSEPPKPQPGLAK
jgi:plasmid maintenance system antidote protein VapI